MKRAQAFPSRYLGKDDVPEPFVATIANVAQEQVNGDRGLEIKAVMTFTNPTIKSLIVNNINWTTCESAYGGESDDWCGQAVEIYVDPNVMFGRERVGGVRLRIPGASRPQAPQTETPADPHARTLDGLRAADSASNADAWIAWGAKNRRTPQQKAEQETTHKLALERIALREGPAGEPEMVGPHADRIPF